VIALEDAPGFDLEANLAGLMRKGAIVGVSTGAPPYA
jgi:hypothetical protein